MQQTNKIVLTNFGLPRLSNQLSDAQLCFEDYVKSEITKLELSIGQRFRKHDAQIEILFMNMFGSKTKNTIIEPFNNYGDLSKGDAEESFEDVEIEIPTLEAAVKLLDAATDQLIVGMVN